MSTLKVNSIEARTGTNISMTSGHTLQANFHSSTAFPAGHVIQTVFGPEFHTEVSTTSGSFVVVSSSLATSITPSFSNSKIIVSVSIPNLMLWNSSADARAQLGISADGGSTFIRETNNRIYDYGGNGCQMHYTTTITGVHSPGATSQQTYNLYWHVDAGNVRINDDQGSEGVSGTAGACFTQFILQEVAQ